MRTFPPTARIAIAATVALLLSSCVDSPAAPERSASPSTFVIAPSLSLAGPGGVPAATAAQNQALNDAFERVDRFRVEVTNGDGAMVLDTIIEVTPGQAEYDFQLPVEATVGEVLSVVLTAFQGETELFRSAPVSVEATSPDVGGENAAAPADVTLSYSGPGADAASLTLDSEAVILASSGTGELAAMVLDDAGDPLSDVPLEWTSSAPDVVTVEDDGSLTARSEGAARVVVATPTGLEAESWVYVVGGTLAYVEGGVLNTRPAAGGGVSRQGGSAATAPAWSADGGVLFYADGGSVRRAPSSTPLVEGGWPSVSPDGRKLAVERSGQIWLANLDGSLPTQGPAGTTPVWTQARSLVVGGGSIQRVGVDGSGRTTVVSGEASLPAVGPSGTVAYVAGGDLMVEGRGEPLASGVSGRPSWSPSGVWLAVTSGDGIVVVPADGTGPALPLPGLGSAGHPAFQPRGALAAAPALGLSGLNPDPALPGRPVEILGSGFDDIIPGNNRVFWPTRDGSVETEVTEATAGALTTIVPDAPAAGDIRVSNGNGEATLAFEPSLGVLEVRAATPWDSPVPGVAVSVEDADGNAVDDGVTDDSGVVVVPGLLPGSYQVTATAPDGFTLDGAATRAVEVSTDLTALELTLVPVPARVEATPSNPTLAVGQTVGITLEAFDVNGEPIERFTSSAWVAGALARLAVSGKETEGTIRAKVPSARPGDATYTVMLSGQVFSLGTTVVTKITGTVSGAPPGGVTVELQDGQGNVLERTNTNAQGGYTFDGLLQGTYKVRPIPPPESTVTPTATTVVIDDDHVRGRADFSIGTILDGATRRPGDIVFYQDYGAWSNKDKTVLSGAPFNFTSGTDYDILGTSNLLEPIPNTTSVAILSSLSSGSSPLNNVNSPTAQASLGAWVQAGGWLIVHAADNVGGDGYLVPGLSGKADDVLQCPGLTVAVGDHPFVRGPDGELGTSDDATDGSVDMDSGCHANHGALSGILPNNAQVLLVEEEGDGRPVYATYPYGSGRVVVTTQTIEYSGHSTRAIINHFWWTLMGGEAPPATVAPALRMMEQDAAAPAAGQSSDVPFASELPGGG